MNSQEKNPEKGALWVVFNTCKFHLTFLLVTIIYINRTSTQNIKVNEKKNTTIQNPHPTLAFPNGIRLIRHVQLQVALQAVGSFSCLIDIPKGEIQYNIPRKTVVVNRCSFQLVTILT